MHTDYLERILNAQVYDVAIETPLDPAPALSARIGNRVLLKREDLQPVFSFKLRGAYNKIAISRRQAQARRDLRVGRQSCAGRRAGGGQGRLPGSDRHADDDATDQDLAVQSRGGEVVLAGESYDDAYTHALELEKSERLSFVHPFDDPEVIAGQGTIGMEILRQHAKPITPSSAVSAAVA
jgi:threonine dehydratase